MGYILPFSCCSPLSSDGICRDGGPLTTAWRRGPVEGPAQSRPLGLDFHRGSVVSPDSASQNLSRDPLLVLPPCPLPATPQPLRVFFSEPTLFWAGGWGTRMPPGAPARSPLLGLLHITQSLQMNPLPLAVCLRIPRTFQLAGM